MYQTTRWISNTKLKNFEPRDLQAKQGSGPSFITPALSTLPCRCRTSVMQCGCSPFPPISLTIAPLRHSFHSLSVLTKFVEFHSAPQDTCWASYTSQHHIRTRFCAGCLRLKNSDRTAGTRALLNSYKVCPSLSIWFFRNFTTTIRQKKYPLGSVSLAVKYKRLNYLQAYKLKTLGTSHWFL